MFLTRNYRMMRNQLYLLFILFTGGAVAADDSWSFIVMADWHGAESFALSPVNDTISNNTYYNETLDVLQYINKNFGGDLVILPGDTNTGKWYTSSFREKLDEYLGLSSVTDLEGIAVAGKNCYSTIKRLFSKAGYNKILMSLGDHELGGDGWAVGSSKKNGLPVFRSSMSRELYEVEGIQLYTAPIGNAPSRPFGTPFVNTSYAHVHKNVLIITVDVFHDTGSNFFDRANGKGGDGSVTVSVEGEHLLWFENVLVEANTDAAIEHVFVQAHIPILQPVRKINSSGQFFDGSSESEFWKLMRKYGVDIYFGGEVHSNTVIKDSKSNLVQVVSRGNRLNNFLKVDVSTDRIMISAFNEIGTEWKWNGNYTKYGQLVIDKTEPNISIKGSGALSVLDRDSGPLIWFKFDENDKHALKDRQVVGLKYNAYQTSLIGDSITIRDEVSTEGMENYGTFGQQYDSQIANIEFENNLSLSEERRGGLFTNHSRFAIGSMGPLSAGDIISCSLFFKTSKSDESILIFYGDRWGEAKAKNLFLVTLKAGNPVLYMNDGNFLTSTDNMHLDNNVWHNIIITMPRSSCLLSEVIMYVNDEKVSTEVFGEDDHIFYTLSGHLSLGGWGHSHDLFGGELFTSIRNFEGSMDDFQLWYDKVLIPGEFGLTENPTETPTEHPTETPTKSPTDSPTIMSSQALTFSPTGSFVGSVPNRNNGYSNLPDTRPVHNMNVPSIIVISILGIYIIFIFGYGANK